MKWKKQHPQNDVSCCDQLAGSCANCRRVEPEKKYRMVIKRLFASSQWGTTFVDRLSQDPHDP